MLRARRLSQLVVGIVSFLVFAIAPLSAVGPSVLMFYGGDLAKPILAFPGNPSITPTSFLWNPVNGGASYGGLRRGTLPQNLEGRRYVSFAVFWGRFDPAVLKPSDASQHGRVYLSTASEQAVVVVTAPNMANAKDMNANPEPVAIPASLGEFVAGWALTPEQTLQLKELAPGLRLR